jgi:hypothetical protein
MAHFAQLDAENNVINVIVVSNSDTSDEYGNEDEQLGIKFCKSLLGDHTIWKQTSYSGRFRKNFAGIGYKYDPVNDAFIPPKPYPSWILDNTVFKWSPPIPLPVDALTNPRGPLNPSGVLYIWNEEIQNWENVSTNNNFVYNSANHNFVYN